MRYVIASVLVGLLAAIFMLFSGCVSTMDFGCFLADGSTDVCAPDDAGPDDAGPQ